MKNLIACLLILFCCITTACHRPYALYQRTAPQTFHSPRPTSPDPVVDSTEWASLAPDSALPLATEPVAYASTQSTTPARTPTTHAARVVQLLINQNRAPSTEQAQPRPKPKSKTQAEPQRKTLREILGLPPRKQLNWWQRISWKLKASVIVILVAVLFAVLHITILAIIFGLIGAFLLIKGLKKSFKVRRPLF